jgi:hypothetical protein
VYGQVRQFVGVELLGWQALRSARGRGKAGWVSGT